METLYLEAEILEEAVCASAEKELRVHCHAASGKGWVEAGGRRFVGRRYVEAVNHLKGHNKIELKQNEQGQETFALAHHVCTRRVGR